MRILGIDPGTATVGWAVLEHIKGKTEPLAYGHISTSKDLPLERRLQEIRDDITAIVKQYQPDAAALEELFFFNNQKTAISVAQSRGALLLTLADFGLSIAGYTPLEVKQALTGYGKADKQQVQRMAKEILKLKAIPKPDDVADALAIALCHLHHASFAKRRV
ncbi:MAG: crossover junction endodeoxyribonuclease RuvC [Candidatus Moraniibacteriota bacterium]